MNRFQIIYTLHDGTKRYYGEYKTIEDVIAFHSKLMKDGDDRTKPEDIANVEVIFPSKGPTK